MVAHCLFHGFQRAGLPHWALASGDNAHATQGIRMTYAGGRQPSLNESAHPFPGDEAGLTAPRQGAVPEPSRLWQLDSAAMFPIMNLTARKCGAGSHDMASDYIAGPDGDFHAWLSNFVTYVSAHLADLGFVAGDLAPVTAAQNTWTTTYPVHTDAQSGASAARWAKDEARQPSDTRLLG
jgi:hypothetical protein